jgi:ribosome-binding ATPase YchF (GTP1/OBG family)
MELAIIGLQNAGKSTFVQVITHGEFVEGAGTPCELMERISCSIPRLQ